MKVRHSLQAPGRCPIDGAVDVYKIVVETDRVIFVETILAKVKALTAEPISQENLTMALAGELRARVFSTCVHSGVHTEVDSE